MTFSTRRLTLIAVLAAMSTVGRIFFQYIPNIQPVTAIIILSSYFLGPVSGIFLAVITTYLTNLIMGMGIWTVWQILAWSFIGFIAGLMGKIRLKKPVIPLAIVSLFSGFLFGFFFAVINYIISGKFLAYYLAGLSFDLNHAFGNVIFIMVLYRPFAMMFENYKI